MLRTILAVVSMGAAVAIFSCSSGKLSDRNDAGARGGAGGAGGVGGGPVDASEDACPGTFVPAVCYRACDGTQTAPFGNTCPGGYVYSQSICFPGPVGIDGSGPITNTCGTDGGGDAAPDGNPSDAQPDACTGTLIPAWCFDNSRSCWAVPSADGGACSTGATYFPENCFHGAVDGRGPICGN